MSRLKRSSVSRIGLAMFCIVQLSFGLHAQAQSISDNIQVKTDNVKASSLMRDGE